MITASDDRSPFDEAILWEQARAERERLLTVELGRQLAAKAEMARLARQARLWRLQQLRRMRRGR
jgi:hypothetical protein